jgi:integrase
MIKKYYVNQPRLGYPFDRRAKKHFSYGFDFRAGGTRYQERGFLTETDAKKAIEAIKARSKAGKYGISSKFEQPYLIELFQKKLDSMNGVDRTRAKRVFKRFLDLLPKTIRVVDLKSSHFRLYNEQREKEGVGAATIRRELVPVVSVLNSADTFLDELEGYRPPKIPRPKVPKTRKSKTIAFHERKAILAWLFDPKNDGGRGLNRRTGLFLAFCLGTASRPGEVAKLKKADVDFLSMTVWIRGTKTRYTSSAGDRILALTPNLEAILKELIPASKTEYIFTRGGRVTSKMYEALKAACEASGIRYGKHEWDGVTFNRSRHTGITEMLSSGVDIQTVGAIVGHSDKTMTMHYAHTTPEAMKDAIIELDNRLDIG